MHIIIIRILILISAGLGVNQAKIMRNQKRIMDKLNIEYPGKDVEV